MMSVLALAKIYLTAMLRRPSYWLLLAPPTLWGAWGMWSLKTTIQDDMLIQSSALAFVASLAAFSIFPLFASMAQTGTFVKLCVSPYSHLILLRVNRFTRILEGIFLGQIVLTILSLVVSMSVLGTLSLVWYQPFALQRPPATFAFMPDLLHRHFIIYLLLLGAIFFISTLAISLTMFALSLTTHNAALGAALPLILIIFAGLALPPKLMPYNPLEQLMFQNTHGYAWLTPQHLALYWGVLGFTAVCALALWCAAKHATK